MFHVKSRRKNDLNVFFQASDSADAFHLLFLSGYEVSKNLKRRNKEAENLLFTQAVAKIGFVF